MQVVSLKTLIIRSGYAHQVQNTVFTQYTIPLQRITIA